jgi:hypothetical protein
MNKALDIVALVDVAGGGSPTPWDAISVLSRIRYVLIPVSELRAQSTVSTIRQKFALLISNENFHDFRICWFRQPSHQSVDFPNASSMRNELSPGEKTVTSPTPLTLQRSDALAALPAKPPEPHRHSSSLSPSRISVSIGRFSWSPRE